MDARQWAVQWLGDPWYFNEYVQRISKRVDDKVPTPQSDADLAEAVRVKWLAYLQDCGRCNDLDSTLEIMCSWFHDGPIAFIEAVREVVGE